jgi:two-component system chemotaxis response regulator CheB
MMRNRRDERDSAEHGQAGLASGKLPKGAASGLSCPECGGALWERKSGKVTQYECHVGHGYTADSLLNLKDGGLENTLWTALRSMEEAADLRRRMARRVGAAPFGRMREKYESEAAELESRAAVLRRVLTDAQG